MDVVLAQYRQISVIEGPYMSLTRSIFVCILILILPGLICWSQTTPQPSHTGSLWSELTAEAGKLKATRTRVDAHQLLAGWGALVRSETQPPAGKETLKVNSEAARGAAMNLYPKVAPSTVMLHVGAGHGTGFVIDPAGWILTNQHVIASAPLDADTGALMVNVHYGRLDDDWMKLADDSLPAIVYKVSDEKDLALLKLVRQPKAGGPLPAISLSAISPPPGADCVAIGNPMRGMLWTVRSGEVAAVGRWPQEMIDVVSQRLELKGEERRVMTEVLNQATPRKVLLSTCGINPGDSGGPLVNDEGELIAVTFAIPRSDPESGFSLDKFSYHVHLDEVKEFLKDRPQRPSPFVPNSWPEATSTSAADTDEDGILDTLVCKLGEEVSGMLLDLDKNSAARLPKDKPLDETNIREFWDFEFAIHMLPFLMAFYDTDGDGKIDLILRGSKESRDAKSELKLADGNWKYSGKSNKALVSDQNFTDKNLRRLMKAHPFTK